MENLLAITGAHVITGTGSPPLAEHTVLIRGDRLHALGPDAEVEIPAEARTIGARGKTVMPGLIDPEVHLSAGPPPSDRASLEFQALKAARSAGLLLRAGYTTVGNVGFGENSDLHLRDAIAQGVVPGPRVLTAGNAVQPTGGHGLMRSPGVPGLRADGVDGVRKAVRAQFEAGADFIKINASGGVEWFSQPHIRNFPAWPNFTPEELRALVDEAHGLGLKVNAHVQSREGVRRCLEAGVDAMEHGSYLETEDLERMKKDSIFLLPTFTHFRQILEDNEARGIHPRALDIIKRHNEAHARSFELARKAGVPFAMCSDSGSSPPHGTNAVELIELVNHGLSPPEALRAATASAAESLGLADYVGTIEAGKRADLILLDGDPLQDLRLLQDMEKILLVVKDGRVVCEGDALKASPCPPLQFFPASG